MSVARSFVKHLILQHTKLTRNHLTPEIALRLITSECPLWTANADNSPFEEPFWAFYWPGGQALTRYVLDNPGHFSQKNILDVGSGCGSAALACQMVGAKSVIANDIDIDALTAIEMNAECNQLSMCKIHLDSTNWLQQPVNKRFDFILMGDMFYDPDFADLITIWLKSIDFTTTTLLVGDPGRLSFNKSRLKPSLVNLVDYELPRSCQLENSGFTQGCVWRYNGG